MTDPLATVTERARAREDAIREYLAAILHARDAGHTLARIGAAAGVTRQAVHEMIQRHEGKGNRYDWPRKPWT